MRPIGHGAEAVRVGRKNQRGRVRQIQSVSVKGKVVIAADVHIIFLIEEYRYIEIIHLLDIFSFLV